MSIFETTGVYDLNILNEYLNTHAPTPTHAHKHTYINTNIHITLLE